MSAEKPKVQVKEKVVKETVALVEGVEVPVMWSTDLPQDIAPPPDTTVVKDGMWLSLCGGMDCLALIAKKLKIRPHRHICVEKLRSARLIAQLHKPSDTHCGVEVNWHTDVTHITKEDIRKLGPVALIAFGAPCEGMSFMRTQPKRFAADRTDRPGFFGPEGSSGRIFPICLQVYEWCVEFNPEVKLFVENVVF